MSKIVIGTADGRNLNVDIPLLIPSRLLIQASSGGGKSWLLRRLAEEFYGKVQTIIIDPEGEFYTLREKFGYVLVGEGGETPADLRSAAMLAEKFLTLKANAVCDLYEAFRAKPLDRRQWVRIFLNALLDAPRTLWHPLVVIVDEAHKFCLDDATEILTPRGWKRRENLSVGDAVVAFDPTTETYKNEALVDVITREHDGPMVSLRSDGIDCLVTPDHRVVYKTVQRAKGRYGKTYGPYIKAAGNLPKQIAVPIGGAPAGIGVPDLGLATCELLGLLITDGGYAGGSEKYLGINQALTTRKAGIDVAVRIRQLVGPVASRYVKKARAGHAAAVSFYLRAKLSKVLIALLPDGLHRIPRYLMDRGSPTQLEALLNGCLLGDGTHAKDKSWGWRGWITLYPGNYEPLADDLQELCTRLGISATKTWVPSISQWHIHLSARSSHYIRSTSMELYKGSVWDVTVPSGAFVARRNGKVFVTGNCPQETPKAGSMIEREIIGGCKDAMIALSTNGRKRGYAAIWATQRLAKVDKDASAELFNRLVGMTIEDVDVDRAADLMSVSKDERQSFRMSLRQLKPGQFYAFGRAITIERKLVMVGPVQTHHPETGAAAKLSEAPPTPDAIKAFLPKLADLPKQAEDKARTEAEYKREIRELKADLRTARVAYGPAPKPAPPVKVADPRAVAAATKPLLKQIETLQRHAKIASELLTKSIVQFKAITMLTPAKLGGNIAPEKVETVVQQGRGRGFATLGRPARAIAESDGDLTNPERRILNACAWLESIGVKQLRNAAVAFLAGYTVGGGGYNNPRGALRTKGLLDYAAGDSVVLTEEGRSMAEVPEAPLTKQELHRRVLEQLPNPEQRILTPLLELYPDSISNEELAAKAGYEAGGGGYNNPRGRLRTLGLVEYTGKGVRAADLLFLEDAA